MAVRTNRWYVSLDVAKRAFLNIEISESSQDARVKDLIRQASDWIEEEIGTYFYPVVETRAFDHAWDTSRLKLDQWLLAITTFTTKNGATPVLAASYDLMQWNEYKKPYNLIRMRSEGAVPALLYTGTTRRANSIAGSWGYCDDTVVTGATLDGALDASAEEFDVDDGSLIEVGQMLLIDSEQMFVESKSGNKVEVERPQGGTTAATHLTGVAISRYAPPDDIETLCGIVVGRLYHRGGTKWTDIPPGPDQGIIYFQDMPAEAKRIISNYKRKWTH